MKQHNVILSLIFILLMTTSLTTNVFSRFELVEQEKKGYSITLDSIPIKLDLTYLNNSNILEVKKDRKRRLINIVRKNKNSIFYSIEDLKTQNKYPTEMQYVTVDGKVLDSLEILETKFEIQSIKHIRLLTQKDYEGKEFDDLPQIKQSVGKGILIIQTE